jgi:rubrerythrin
MRPGAASNEGFLAPGESLRDVIHRDEQTLQRVKVEPERIADHMEEIIGKACRIELADLRNGGYGNHREKVRQWHCSTCGWQSRIGDESDWDGRNCPRCGDKLRRRFTRAPWIVVDGRWRVTGFDVVKMGHQECPFEDVRGVACD